ncbi:MAG: protein BmrU [Pirellulaceae bacterium]|nr:MAG: protein BmrU [Pirellulaceae bacterium]
MNVGAGDTVLVVVNPRSGNRDRREDVAQLAARVERAGLTVQSCTDLNNAAQVISALHDAGRLRTVVAAGGDGTVRSVVNWTPAGVPVLVYPLGTENLLARYLGMPRDAAQLAEILLHGRTVVMDAGRIGERLFLVVATCGFDAQVVARMDQLRRGNISRWTYAWPILHSLFTYRFPKVHVRVEGPAGVEEHDAGWVFVFNAPSYAAHIPICPEADPTDGLLDVCTFRRRGIVWGLWYLGRVWTGSHRKSRQFFHRRCYSVRLTGAGDAFRRGRPLYQQDGDLGGHLPVDIQVLPRRARFVVPH